MDIWRSVPTGVISGKTNFMSSKCHLFKVVIVFFFSPLSFSMQVDSSSPSPDPIDNQTTQVTTIGTISDSPLDCSAPVSAGIVTLKPFSPRLGNSGPLPQRKSRKFRTKNNATTNKVGLAQTIPGVFESTSYSKYLVFSIENQSISDMDIFKVNREIVDCIGRKPKISPQGGNSLLIEAASPEESEKLQKLSQVNDCKSTCTPHKTLNQCRGIIYSRDLVNYSETRLLEEFADQKVTNVKRVTKKVDGNVLPTPLLIITFDLLTLPNYISAAWYEIPVKPFIPSPRRCYYCQVFGHVFSTCRKRTSNEPSVCVNCGQQEHGDCNKLPLCVNCHGNHAASSKVCSRYLFEKEILTVKTKEKLGYKEARDRVKLQNRFQFSTYASVVKSNSSVPSHVDERMDTSVSNKRTRSSDSIELPVNKLKQSVTVSGGPVAGPSALVGAPRADPSASVGGGVAGPSTSVGGSVDGPTASIGGPVAGPSTSSGGLGADPTASVERLVARTSTSGGSPVAVPSTSFEEPVVGSTASIGGPVADPSACVGEPVAGPSVVVEGEGATPLGFVEESGPCDLASKEELPIVLTAPESSGPDSKKSIAPKPVTLPAPQGVKPKAQVPLKKTKCPNDNGVGGRTPGRLLGRGSSRIKR